jgi:Glu-tRNA(Gln) amidotransferase subunit E-like FAD-binding protein
LNDELSQQLIHNRDKLVLFNKVTEETNVDNKITASLILTNPFEKLGVDAVVNVFKFLESSKFSKEAVPQIVAEMLLGKTIEKAMSGFKTIASSELSSLVKSALKKHKKDISSPYIHGIVMKELMAELRGKVDAAELSKLIQFYLGEK